MGNNKPLVAINCYAFNQEQYIRNCLEGFVMQKTNFDFVAIVHDDASSDKTADIIREYKSKYPDIICAILEVENQYSKRDGSLQKVMNAAIDKFDPKYTAFCEGDDYWIDPYKLQKQVDWLEKHPDYSMCCSDAIVQASDRELDWSRYEQDADISIPEMVLGGGAYIQTCSILYKKSLLCNYPVFCKRSHVGDYPLQMWCSTQGKVRYFAEKQVVYRYGAVGSWTNSQNASSLNRLIKGWRTELDMLDGFNEYTSKKYEFAFKLAFFRNLYIQASRYGIDNRALLNEFNSIELYPFERLFDDFFKWCFDESCDKIQKKFRKRILRDNLLFYYELGVIYPYRFLINVRNIHHKLLVSHKESYNEILSKDFYVMKKYSLRQVLFGYAAFCETKYGVFVNNLRVKIGIRSLLKI